MKIEKISDNQIRCTLNREDLASRQLKISELAYGTEKAKALFQDMMQQANCEFGFEADDIPLMIEAIPVSPECLILLVTKVEDPEELDTRFSNFTPFSAKEQQEEEPENPAYADEILNCFEHLEELLGKFSPDNHKSPSVEADSESITASIPSAEDLVSVQTSLTKVYSFRSFQEVRNVAAVIAPFYSGENTLFRDSHANCYYLVVHMSDHTAEEFNKVCNILSDYGRTERTTYASISYYEEHYEAVILASAIQHLSKLG